ncbi:hypothetical protein, partial [Sunxiuqinia dokdonensis]|uniref:hypothetical protein n=1 Tax=Sunxiuqinia dokdonensis TaxID=1409788 RepID=UPI0019555E79
LFLRIDELVILVIKQNQFEKLLPPRSSFLYIQPQTKPSASPSVSSLALSFSSSVPLHALHTGKFSAKFFEAFAGSSFF